jgi:hypothetical protein
VLENYVPGTAPDQVGGGGASPMGMNPFVALPPGKEDMSYADAVGQLLSPAMRAAQAEMAADINEGAKRLGPPTPFYSGVRGQYTPGSNILALTERADPSTFMHEMAHWYLHQVQVLASRGDGWATGELAAITEWYEGIKTGEQMQTIRARYRVVEEAGQFRLMYKNRLTIVLGP